jgi:hypothetical protein
METSLLRFISISFIVPIDRLFAPRYLHKILVDRGGRSHRELWHDHVQEIDMTNETGGMTVGDECGREKELARRCCNGMAGNLFTERPPVVFKIIRSGTA